MKIKLTTTTIKSTDAESANVSFYSDEEFASYLKTTYVDTNKVENKQMLNDTVEIESKQYSRKTTTMTFISNEVWDEYKNDTTVKNFQALRRAYNLEKGIRSQTITEMLVETPI